MYHSHGFGHPAVGKDVANSEVNPPQRKLRLVFRHIDIELLHSSLKVYSEPGLQVGTPAFDQDRFNRITIQVISVLREAAQLAEQKKAKD